MHTWPIYHSVDGSITISLLLKRCIFLNDTGILTRKYVWIFVLPPVPHSHIYHQIKHVNVCNVQLLFVHSPTHFRCKLRCLETVNHSVEHGATTDLYQMLCLLLLLNWKCLEVGFSAFSIVTVHGMDDRNSIPGRDRVFLFAVTSRSALIPLDTWGCFPCNKRGRSVKLTTHLHLVSRLRMCGAIAPRPHTS